MLIYQNKIKRYNTGLRRPTEIASQHFAEPNLRFSLKIYITCNNKKKKKSISKTVIDDMPFSSCSLLYIRNVPNFSTDRDSVVHRGDEGIAVAVMDEFDFCYRCFQLLTKSWSF